MESNRRCEKSTSNRAPTKSAVNVKQIADSPLQSEYGKKRKKESEYEGNFTQVVFKARKKKTERDRR